MRYIKIFERFSSEAKIEKKVKEIWNDLADD